MIKLEFKQEPYYFEKIGEGQFYGIETKMELNEDIDATEAIIAFLRLLNIAKYHVTVDSVQNLVYHLKDCGYADDERII